MKTKAVEKRGKIGTSLKKNFCAHKLEYLSLFISIVTAVIVFFQTERLAHEANQLTQQANYLAAQTTPLLVNLEVTEGGYRITIKNGMIHRFGSAIYEENYDEFILRPFDSEKLKNNVMKMPDERFYIDASFDYVNRCGAFEFNLFYFIGGSGEYSTKLVITDKRMEQQTETKFYIYDDRDILQKKYLCTLLSNNNEANYHDLMSIFELYEKFRERIADTLL
jgi:hypothetical protein